MPGGMFAPPCQLLYNASLARNCNFDLSFGNAKCLLLVAFCFGHEGHARFSLIE